MSRFLKNSVVLVICLTTLMAPGCGDDEQPAEPQQSPQPPSPPAAMQDAPQPPMPVPQMPQMPTQQQMTEAAKKTADAMARMNQGAAVEPADFRQLKALLPETLTGMTRSDASGERTSMMGMTMSRAEAEYRATADGSGRLDISIMDLGAMTGPAGMSMAAWAMVDIDRETDSGYQRTITYKGHKAMEEYDSTSRSGSLQIFVAKRFMVHIESNDLPAETLKTVADKIDLAKLTSLASSK